MKEIYTPSQMAQLQRKVIFRREDYPSNQELLQAVEDFQIAEEGTIYTGIHKENDWTRTAWWYRGWHLVNRTGEYMVLY